MKLKLILVSISLGMLTIFSCNPLRHWQKVATDTKVTPEKKAIIAPKVAVLFPSQTKFLPGEVIRTVDTLYEQDADYILEVNALLDSLLYKADDDKKIIDSLRIVILKRKLPVTIQVKEKSVDTTFIPDPALSATLFSTQQSLATCEMTNASLQADLDDKEKDNDKLAKSKYTWLYWFIGTALALLCSIILHFKRR